MIVKFDLSVADSFFPSLCLAHNHGKQPLESMACHGSVGFADWS